jgi:ankyrin repeat protein
MAAQATSQMEGRALLGMARDNKPEDIKNCVALGVPVDFPNPVRRRRLSSGGAVWAAGSCVQRCFDCASSDQQSPARLTQNAPHARPLLDTQIGQTALMVASLWGNVEAIQVRRRLEALPSAEEDDGSLTPKPPHQAAVQLQILVTCASSQLAKQPTDESIQTPPPPPPPQTLLKLGADPNKTNQGGATALHFAASAKRNSAAVCEALLAAGADTSVVDDMG